MIYYSKVTAKGNSSYSYSSQEAAKEAAKYLDDNGCSDCSGCSGCSDAVIQSGRPNGWPCYGWLKDGRLFIHCGCQRKTLAEAREYWSGKNDRREVLAAVEYIAKIAELKGWAT